MAKEPRKSRPRVPTSALDHAVAALARNEPEDCLRLAIPVLNDVGAGAPALDLIARASVSLGNMRLARTAYETAARALALQGIAAHAVAAAVGVFRLNGSTALLEELAGVFGADADRDADVAVRPPPLRSDDVKELAPGLTRKLLLEMATTRVDEMQRDLPKRLPPRARHPLWGSLPTGAFVRFAQALEVRLLPGGETVIREGDEGGSVFVVARGEVRVLRRAPSLKVVVPEEGDAGDSLEAPVPDEMEELAALGAEAVVGEMALLTAAPRVASAVTSEPTLLLEAPRAALEKAISEVPALGDSLRAYGHRRLIQNLLRSAPLLREVPGEERTSLAGAFTPRSFAAGEVLFAQGAESVGLHLIASGSVDVLRREGDEPLRVAQVGPGGCVGEISLVLRRPTSAAVVATEPTEALVLAPDQFLAVARAHPALLASLYEVAVQRDEELHSVLAQPPEDADDLML